MLFLFALLQTSGDNIDLQGTAVVIGAIAAGIATVIGAFGTLYLQLKAAKMHDKDKLEAIAAREQQNVKIAEVHGIVSTVAPVVLGTTGESKIPPPAPPPSTDPDKVGGV